MTKIKNWIKRQPVVAFYVFAFFLTWLGWVPQAAYSHGFFPFDSPVFYVFGGMGPLAAALIVAHFLYGKKDAEVVFEPLLRWRVKIIWYIIATAGSIVLMLAAMALRREFAQGARQLLPSMAMLLSFLRYFVAAIPEEVAWRGFVLPRLQAKYNPMIASLIIGVLWAIWHIPLLLIQDSVMSTYPLLPYFISTMSITIIYTWMYNCTKGSVFIAVLFHTVSNVFGPFAGMEQALIELTIAVIIVMIYRSEFLVRHNEPVADNGQLTSGV